MSTRNRKDDSTALELEITAPRLQPVESNETATRREPPAIWHEFLRDDYVRPQHERLH